MTEPNKDLEPCACEGPEKPADKATTRRDFLLKMAIGLNVVAGTMISLPLIGYVMSSFVKKLPLQWVSLGAIDQFPEGTTRLANYVNPDKRPWDGATATIPCWVRRIQGQEFQVFAINCTHLGCPVRWFEESRLFMCPCHGGAYYEDGGRASGPPPRGLYTYQFKVEKNELSIAAGVLPTLASPQV